MKPAFYDPTKSYEDNYHDGPPVFLNHLTPPERDLSKAKKFNHLGFEINLPFGVPPGPLLNSQYMKAAFEWGFDVSTYKTVRANEFPCHPFPNILYVEPDKDLHPDKTPRLVASPTTIKSKEEFSITNSFGVPSRKPVTWQEDVKKALSYEKNGQLLILSFMGTVREGQTKEEFIEDHRKAAEYALATGVKVFEVNLSCPNIGNEGLICYDLSMTEAIADVLKKTLKGKPLILKVGYYKNDRDIEKLAEITNKYAHAVAAIKWAWLDCRLCRQLRPAMY